MYAQVLPAHIQLSAMREAGENLDAFDIIVNGTVVKTVQFSTAQNMGSSSEEWVYAQARDKAVEWLVQNRYLEGPLRERPFVYKIICARSEQTDDYGPSYSVVRSYEFEVGPGQNVRQRAAEEWQEILKRAHNQTFIGLELVEKVDWTPEPPQQAAA